jgi:hypothetical protein
MASPFSKVRDPDRWAEIERDFPKGCHWFHSVERIFAHVLFSVNDACRDLNIRGGVPKLELNGRQKSTSRSLSVRHRNVTVKRIAVKLDGGGCLIGENYICLDSAGAAARLANALVDILEKTWNSNGR